MARAAPHKFSFRARAEEAAADLPALMAKAERAVTSVLLGEHPQRKTGAGEKFWQFRDYIPGDRPQDIDWRRSGRADSVYIRQKEWQTPQTTIFWCNRSACMDFSSDPALESKAETAKILTLALAILYARNGDQVGIFGHRRTGRSEAALERIGQALIADAPGERPVPDLATFTCPKNSSLVQVGDFLEPPDDLEKVFRSLAAQSENGLLVQVLDPAEIALPYAGRVAFETIDKAARETIKHVGSVRAAYQKRIEDHLKAVEALCVRHRWHYILHRTDRPVKDTLAALWARLHLHEPGPTP